MDLLSSMNALSSSLQNASNIALTAHVKKRDRKFMKEMYEKQLADNRENWRMQNEYNAPSAQMERLQSAGLNPHLIYGSGAVANSASMPSSATTGTGGYSSVPRLEQMNILGQYLQLREMKEDVQHKELTNEYLKQTLDARVGQQGEILDRLQQLALIMRDERQMKSYQRQAEADIANIKQILIHGDKASFWNPIDTIDVPEDYAEHLKDSPLFSAVQGAMLKDGIEPVLMSKKLDILQYEFTNILPQKLRHMTLQNAILDVQANLWRMGINPSDPMWMRIIATALTRWLGVTTDDVENVLKGVGKAVVSPFGGVGPAPTHEDPYLDW